MVPPVPPSNGRTRTRARAAISTFLLCCARVVRGNGGNGLIAALGVAAMSELGRTLIAQLDADDMRELAEQLAPFMPTRERTRNVPALMRVVEAAKVLGVSAKTVRRRIADGLLPAVVEHGRVMVRTDELAAYVEGLARVGPRPARRRRRPARDTTFSTSRDDVAVMST